MKFHTSGQNTEVKMATDKLKMQNRRPTADRRQPEMDNGEQITNNDDRRQTADRR
jgi:hypothetical protein